MGVTIVRLSPEVEETLATVAERARRTRSWLINEAVKDYLERVSEDKMRWSETLEALRSVRASTLSPAQISSTGLLPGVKGPRSSRRGKAHLLAKIAG